MRVSREEGGGRAVSLAALLVPTEAERKVGRGSPPFLKIGLVLLVA